VEILSDETDLVIHEGGRESWTWHVIYRAIDAHATPERWKEARAGWNRWTTERPDVRARVISPDGVEHWLDSKLLHEVPAAEEDAIYSDARVLRAPLPSVVDGSVIEIITRQDAVPWAHAGVVHAFPLQNWVPTRRLSVHVEAPSSSPLRLEVTGGTWVPEERVSGQIRSISLELGPTEALKDDERGTPTDFPATPGLWVSTTPDWQRAAAEYSAVVDRQLASTDLRVRAQQVIGAERDARVAANKVLTWMQSLRYASVDFGDTSVIPRPPDETLRRQFGDCKDLATLIVGMLRAAGFEAWTALLLTEGHDNFEHMPGLNRFNHVIVRVGGTAPFWIDGTAFSLYPAGVLPMVDQGRMALVAAPGTTGLVQLPVAAAATNRELREVRAEFGEVGAGTIDERYSGEGFFAAGFRPLGSKGLAAQREHWEKWFKTFYDAPGLGTYDVIPGGLTDPVRQHLQGTQVRSVWTSVTTASFSPNRERVFDDLPRALTASYDPEKSPLRKSPLVVYPSDVELRYLLVPPKGFVARPPSPSFEMPLGRLTFSRTETLGADGSVRISFRLRNDATLLTAEEVDAFRRAFVELRTRPEVPVVFDAAVSLAVERGQVGAAVEESRALIAADPTNAMHHVRLARAFLAAGFGARSRDEAGRAVELAPASPDARVELGYALSHDALGRRFAKGWDRTGTVNSLMKAREIKYDGSTAAQLAFALEHGPDGEHFGSGSELDSALAIYDFYREREKKHDLDLPRAVVALRGRHLERALGLIRELEDSEDRDRLLIACVALKEGSAAANDEAGRLAHGPSQQAKALESAAETLMGMREYATARSLILAAEGISPAYRDETLGVLLEHAERVESRHDRAPEATVRKTIAAAVLGTIQQPILSARRSTEVRELRDAYRSMFTALLQRTSSRTVALDLLLGVIQVSANQLPNGSWRARSTSILGRAPNAEVWTLGPGAQPALVAVHVEHDSPAGLVAGTSSSRTESDRARAAGDFTKARNLRLSLVLGLRATLEDQMLVALDSLAAGDCGDIAFTSASAAVWMTTRADANALDTLALVFVTRGELLRAHALAVEALALRVETEPTPLDWVVIGKTAQALGLSVEAQTAYSHAVESSQRSNLVEDAALNLVAPSHAPRLSGTVRASL
jgi:hypothetical protein